MKVGEQTARNSSKPNLDMGLGFDGGHSIKGSMGLPLTQVTLRGPTRIGCQQIPVDMLGPKLALPSGISPMHSS